MGLPSPFWVIIGDRMSLSASRSVRPFMWASVYILDSPVIESCDTHNSRFVFPPLTFPITTLKALATPTLQLYRADTTQHGSKPHPLLFHASHVSYLPRTRSASTTPPSTSAPPSAAHGMGCVSMCGVCMASAPGGGCGGAGGAGMRPAKAWSCWCMASPGTRVTLNHSPGCLRRR